MMDKGYLSVADLSRRSGIHANTLGPICRNEKQTGPLTIERLCIALLCQPGDILENRRED